MDKSEVLGPPSEPLEIQTELPLKSPRVVNLSCVAPDELRVEWSSDIISDLYFLLRYRSGNVSSFIQLRINASLDDWDLQEVSQVNTKVIIEFE